MLTRPRIINRKTRTCETWSRI